MTESTPPERDHGKRIIRFRQHAFLLHTRYSQTAIAARLGATKENYNKYYNDPQVYPGIKFLDKFDETFAEEVRKLIDHLKMYHEEDIPLAADTSYQYLKSGYLEEYIQALKDQIDILKKDVAAGRGDIEFLKYVIRQQEDADNIGEQAASSETD